MRDRFKILAAKEMAQGHPKKGMVVVATFRFRSDAQKMWKDYTKVTMKEWYLQFTERMDILEIYDPKAAGFTVTGYLAKEEG